MQQGFAHGENSENTPSKSRPNKPPFRQRLARSARQQLAIATGNPRIDDHTGSFREESHLPGSLDHADRLVTHDPRIGDIDLALENAGIGSAHPDSFDSDQSSALGPTVQQPRGGPADPGASRTSALIGSCLVDSTVSGRTGCESQATWIDRLERPRKNPVTVCRAAASGFVAAPRVTNNGAKCSTVGWA